MESKPLVVVGAGVSGTAAAIEAAKAGVQVTLIDENPIGMSMMGLDVPQFFGRRIEGALSDRAAMLERVVAANEDLAEAVEAGVDVRLGTCVWGAFRNAETSKLLDGPQLGLADQEQSWVMSTTGSSWQPAPGIWACPSPGGTWRALWGPTAPTR